jgi:uncharacterized GH25 family protein
VYNKYQVFNFTSHSSTGLEHDSLGSCKIKFARKILALPTNQTLYLLISILFVESSHAYPANNLIKPGNMTTINTAALTETNKLHNNIQSQNEVTSNTTTHSLQIIADSSQITKSISTNAQGADTKTYRIKPAKTLSKVDNKSQTNKLNMSTMKWESELKSIELLKSSSHSTTSYPKFK